MLNLLKDQHLLVILCAVLLNNNIHIPVTSYTITSNRKSNQIFTTKLYSTQPKHDWRSHVMAGKSSYLQHDYGTTEEKKDEQALKEKAERNNIYVLTHQNSSLIRNTRRMNKSQLLNKRRLLIEKAKSYERPLYPGSRFACTEPTPSRKRNDEKSNVFGRNKDAKNGNDTYDDSSVQASNAVVPRSEKEKRLDDTRRINRLNDNLDYSSNSAVVHETEENEVSDNTKDQNDKRLDEEDTKQINSSNITSSQESIEENPSFGNSHKYFHSTINNEMNKSNEKRPGGRFDRINYMDYVPKIDTNSRSWRSQTKWLSVKDNYENSSFESNNRRSINADGFSRRSARASYDARRNSQLIDTNLDHFRDGNGSIQEATFGRRKVNAKSRRRLEDTRRTSRIDDNLDYSNDSLPSRESDNGKGTNDSGDTHEREKQLDSASHGNKESDNNISGYDDSSFQASTKFGRRSAATTSIPKEIPLDDSEQNYRIDDGTIIKDRMNKRFIESSVESSKETKNVRKGRSSNGDVQGYKVDDGTIIKNRMNVKNIREI